MWLRVGGWLTHRFQVLNALNAVWLRSRDRWFPTGLRRLEYAIGESDSMLEVGCGDSSPIAWFRRKPAVCVGVDLFEPSIERSRAAGIHTDYRKLDVRELAEHFEPDSFEVVAAFDLIEHLTEPEGLRLLEDMERVASKRVVLFTPNGFLPQGEYGGNPWQVHKSGWSAKRMRALGYRVHGLSGLKWLRSAYATPRWRPHMFWEFVSAVTQPAAYHYPSMAFQILCVKEL